MMTKIELTKVIIAIPGETELPRFSWQWHCGCWWRVQGGAGWSLVNQNMSWTFMCSSARFIVWSRNPCWSLGMLTKQGSLRLDSCFFQMMPAEQWAVVRVLAQWSRKLCNKIILILFKCARFYLCTLFLFGRHILQSGIHVIIRYSMMSA